ncbi:hypothetical protein [Rappaport israeli]|uniref:hypothetical protein n=1 Tax=Rappaport israeli TaxID=1839807 RepID=UPI000930789E|nr:hypothetical protein [Rappaport israeli]
MNAVKKALYFILWLWTLFVVFALLIAPPMEEGQISIKSIIAIAGAFIVIPWVVWFVIRRIVLIKTEARQYIDEVHLSSNKYSAESPSHSNKTKPVSHQQHSPSGGKRDNKNKTIETIGGVISILVIVAGVILWTEGILAWWVALLAVLVALAIIGSLFAPK